MKLNLLIFFVVVSIYRGFSQTPSNDLCSGAVTVAINGTCYNGTNVGAADNMTSAYGCQSGTTSQHKDVWYSFIAGSTATYSYNITGALTNKEILIISSTGACSGLTPIYVNCAASTAALTGTITGLSPGTTYYYLISAPNNETGTFSTCITMIPDPAGTNCINGTQVCSNGSISGSSSGAGTQELTPTNEGCLLSGENNSHWFYLNVGTGGTLTFTVAPSNGTDDYDFALWGPTNVCPPSVAPIRCNYAQYPRSSSCGTNTNPTGLDNISAITSAAACDNVPFLQQLTVTAGQVYILLVNGFTPSASPFNLTFGGTAILSCSPAVVTPIKLLYFTANVKDKIVDLTWGTGTELNNSYFTIEKSLNGIDFTQVTIVEGAGNSVIQKNYNAQDLHPNQGISYYRLKQTDFDKKSTYSQIQSVNFSGNDTKFDFTIFPNPSDKNDNLYLQFNGKENELIYLLILEITGRLLFEKEIQINSNSVELKMDLHLNSGIYFAKVLNKNGTQVNQKLIIE